MSRRYVRRDSIDEHVANDGPNSWGDWIGRWRGAVRAITGIATIVALIVIAVNVFITHAGAERDLEAGLSAIRVMQIYVQGVFLAVLTIGASIAIYIFTRADD